MGMRDYGFRLIFQLDYVLFANSGRGVSHFPHCGNLVEFTLTLTHLAIWWVETLFGFDVAMG